jgi:hypothetical protein
VDYPAKSGHADMPKSFPGLLNHLSFSSNPDVRTELSALTRDIMTDPPPAIDEQAAGELKAFMRRIEARDRNPPNREE